MTKTDTDKPTLGGLGKIRRRTVSIAREELVEERPLSPDAPLPRVVEPAGEALELTAWAQDNRDLVHDRVASHGAVLLRGFQVGSDAAFQEFMEVLVGRELLDYTYRSTPRQQVQGKVYTSTEYPADQEIPMHNEMSYTTTWPRIIWFYCPQPAQSGGETPIADSAEVYRRIDPAVRDRFAEQGVLYVRNYGGGLDLSWQEVFQTRDRDAVEEACRQRGIEWEWLGDDRLRTRQRCQGVARHPDGGEPLWFNQAHLFHVSSVPEELRRAMVESFGEEGLPRNAFYGDGNTIEDEALESIRAAYRATMVAFPWRKGDVMMLDNMRVAHGRHPFTGPRRVVVGMAQPWSDAGE